MGSIDVNMAEGVSSDEDLETFLSKLEFTGGLIQKKVAVFACYRCLFSLSHVLVCKLHCTSM